MVNQLETNINYEIVNINIVLSVFEENSCLLLNELIKQISSLSDSGAISHISIKAFVIISKSKDLLKTEEQIITYENFEKLKEIKSKFNNIFQNVVFIDNLNKNAVFLDIDEYSIGFVLNEFTTYLMTNHYKMIGNLFNAEFISLGLGTLFFDEKFFLSFFRYKIINKFTEAEQLDELKKWFKTTEYIDLRDNTFYPFLRNEVDINRVISEIKNRLDNNNFTLFEYKFLLSNLLGRHDDVLLEKPFNNVEQISLYDLVFNILNNFNQACGGQDLNILSHKSRIDKKIELEAELSNLIQKKNSGPCSKLKNLEKRIRDLQKNTGGS